MSSFASAAARQPPAMRSRRPGPRPRGRSSPRCWRGCVPTRSPGRDRRPRQCWNCGWLSGKGDAVRRALEASGMPQNFIECGREQAFLMPPSLLDWVPEDHLVWTVLDAVAEMDLGAFYASYRVDGHGRPAYEPSMMVALLLYAYARGTRSSRGIERACVEDVAYRVICSNLVPDHSTIAEFRVRHEDALAELFTAVLGLCRRAGLVSGGGVAVDGTKVQASASREAN